MTQDSSSPAEALAAARRSREAVLDRLQWPRWFTAVQAGLIGATFAGQVLSGVWPTFVACGCAIALARRTQALTERTGLSLPSFGPGRARWVAFGFSALLIALYLGSFRLRYEADLWWAPLPVGLLAALAAYFGARLWLSVYRAELRDRA